MDIDKKPFECILENNKKAKGFDAIFPRNGYNTVPSQERAHTNYHTRNEYMTSLLWFFWSCSGGKENASPLTIYATTELDDAIREYVLFLDRNDVQLEISTGSACSNGDIELVFVPDMGECYEILSTDTCTQVSGGLLGVQYGLSAVLEKSGMGFFHPHATQGPESIQIPKALSTAEPQCPQMARRGIHMHTLHPIEGYFDAWDSKGDLNNIRRIGDWVIKNRGNHLQWVALDSTPENWEEHSTLIVQDLQARGLTTGLGIQLFSESNLQEAMNLVHNSDGDYRPQMEQEWSRVTNIGFDLFNLSFGEFFNSDPEIFIDSINLSYDVLQELAPGTEMTTVLHVGDEQRVSYQGEEWIYYNLAQFARPEIKPWVHTVMFYNLYDDAGGAYHHEEFDQHRSIIERYLQEGRPIGYFPESAYWCAFDSPIPQYLPVYVYSRWKDMDKLIGLDDHVLFSSGWEWGYWLNDAATLRMNWKVPTDHCETLRDMLEPVGEPALAEAICALSKLQHEALIENRLAPWTAGFDSAMEVGSYLGIVAQPERKAWSALDESDLPIANALDQLATETEEVLHTIPQSSNRWIQETIDGFEANVLRAQFAAHLIRASINKDEASIAAAELLQQQAATVVQRRHSALHDPQPDRLRQSGDNHTFYDYGYLHWADQLCFYERELTQVKNYVLDESNDAPGCLF